MTFFLQNSPPMRTMNMLSNDAFFSTGTRLERVGVVGPDLDCWRAGLQAPGSSGLR